MNSMNLIKTHYEVTLSQEAWAGVETVARKFNLSVSELFEQVGCGLLAVIDPEEVEDIEDYLDFQPSLEAEAVPEDQEQISWELAKQKISLYGITGSPNLQVEHSRDRE